MGHTILIATPLLLAGWFKPFIENKWPGACLGLSYHEDNTARVLSGRLFRDLDLLHRLGGRKAFPSAGAGQAAKPNRLAATSAASPITT